MGTSPVRPYVRSTSLPAKNFTTLQVLLLFFLRARAHGATVSFYLQALSIEEMKRLIAVGLRSRMAERTLSKHTIFRGCNGIYGTLTGLFIHAHHPKFEAVSLIIPKGALVIHRSSSFWGSIAMEVAGYDIERAAFSGTRVR